MLKNIKTIIFDYDGTLHDSTKIYTYAFRKVFAMMVEAGEATDRDYSEEEITKWLGFTAQEMWDDFMPDLPQDKKNRYSLKIGEYMYEKIQNNEAVLYEGALETLQYLKERGYHVLYLSNCGPDYMNMHAKCFGLRDYFDHMYCTGDYNMAPKYEIFEYIKAAYPGEYLVVGDRFKDIEIADYHKVYTVGALYGFGSKDELASADLLIDDIRDLRKYL